ncbi:MAG: LamG domain protein jellyroll fold domain protein [Myxococcales bacterium]|nr:LamG domain protein jellyroll fold domain protein [Myxococcales bacterium]
MIARPGANQRRLVVMRRAGLLLIALAGCGRIGFGPTDGIDSTGDGGVGTGDSGGVQMPAGLIAWYQLEEANPTFGGFALDSTGRGHDASCTACPMRVPGRPTGTGFAALFDGTDDHFLISAAGTELDMTTFTITAWVKPEARPGTFESIVSRPLGLTQNSFTVDHEAMGRLTYVSQGNSTLFGMTQLGLGAWTHVAISFDGTFKRLYRNGNFEGSGSNGTGVTYDVNAMLLGADMTNASATNFFRGTIDEVRVYNRQLTDAEVGALAMQ